MERLSTFENKVVEELERQKYDLTHPDFFEVLCQYYDIGASIEYTVSGLVYNLKLKKEK
jgi:hypothetical protein